MYFEDIFRKVEPLWKREFSLEGVKETETYVLDLKDEYNRIEDIVDFSNKEDYSEWESMLIFTMYQTLTAYALEKWKNEKSSMITIDEIPITLFERQFKRNMEPKGEVEADEKLLKQYQGFRNPPVES
jgi:hypothetical protein